MSNKLIIVGTTGVGKTTFLKRIRFNEFDSNHISTIGVDITKYQGLDIFDTAGNYNFICLGEEYYLNSKYAIVMFDLSIYRSFRYAVQYINDIIRICGNDCHIVLVGNKCESDKIEVNYETIEKLMNKIKFIKKYFEVSVKEKTNCNDVISYINSLNDIAGV